MNFNAVKTSILLLSHPEALKNLITWPVFSVTSFFMLKNLSKQGLNPKIIIDVGANKGQFSIAAANTFKEADIYSYEPVPETYQQLKKNTLNKVKIKTKCSGIGEIVGELPMHINSHSHSSSMLHLADAHKQAFPNAEESHEVIVPVTTLDNEFESIDLSDEVLLKIDVQGFESYVLNGAIKTLKNTNYVLLEVSFKPMYEDEIIFDGVNDILKKLGFKFLRPVDWLIDPNSGEYLQMDALFIRE